MKFYKKKIIIFLLLILSISFVSSKTYYVNIESGSNNNDGLSINKPFKTLDYAIAKLNKKDILFILNGTYYLNDKIRISNIDFNNTIISAYPKHKPTIKNNIQKYENPNSNTWTKVNNTNLNLWYSYYNTTNTEFIAQYLSNKVSLLSYNNYNEFIDRNKPDGIYYDKSNKKLYVKFKDLSKNPNNIKLLISNDHAFELFNVKGLTIANLSIMGATRCINIDESSNINIEGNTCFGGFLGISVKTSRIVNIVKNTAYMIRDPTFEYFDMKNKPYETTGIFLQDNYEGINIKNNKVYGHFNGILTYSTSKGKLYNAEISYNTIYDIYDDAIEIENYCNGAKYHHNNIKDSFVGISLSPADASEKRCYIYNNLIVADKKVLWNRKTNLYYDGECFKIIDPIPTQNFNYSRNTCIGRAIYSLDYEKSTQKNSIWENNIFYSENKKIIVKSGLSSNGVYYNNNIYFRKDNGTLFQYWNSDTNNREFYSLKEAMNSNLWDKKWDTNSKNVNPLFNDISREDFRPKSNSIACKMSTTGSYVGAFPCIELVSCGNEKCDNGETCSSCSIDCGICPVYEYHWIEAEFADKISPSMKIGTDLKASNSKYIYSTNSSSNNYTIIKFKTNTSGIFILYGRVNSQDENSNSFFIKIDNSKEILWDLSTNSNWVWKKIVDRSDSKLNSFNLSEGTHTLYIKKRETNSKIDKILITNKLDYIPNDLGEKAENMQYCGDNKCNNGETCSSCSIDCGTCQIKEYCGDEICNNNEDCNTCSSDCGQCVVVESKPKSSGRSRSSGSGSVYTGDIENQINNTKSLDNTSNNHIKLKLEEKNNNETTNPNYIYVESNKLNEKVNLETNLESDKINLKKENSTNKLTGNIIKINDNNINNPPSLMPLFIMLLLGITVYSLINVYYTNIEYIKPLSHNLKSKLKNILLNILFNRISNVKNKHIYLKNRLNVQINKTKTHAKKLTTEIPIFVSLLKINILKLYSRFQFYINSIKLPKFNFKINNYLKINNIKFFVNNIKSKSPLTKSIITNEIKKEWHKYFIECEKIGFTLNEIKEFLLFEKGYDKNLIELLIKDYQNYKYLNDEI